MNPTQDSLKSAYTSPVKNQVPLRFPSALMLKALTPNKSELAHKTCAGQTPILACSTVPTFHPPLPHGPSSPLATFRSHSYIYTTLVPPSFHPSSDSITLSTFPSRSSVLACHSLYKSISFACSRMCNSKVKSGRAVGLAAVAEIDGRPVLQPASNRVITSEATKPLKKTLQKSTSLPTSVSKNAHSFDVVDTNDSLVILAKLSAPLSPTSKPPKTLLKRSSDTNGLNSSTEKLLVPKAATPKTAPVLVRKKSKKSTGGNQGMLPLDSLLFSAERAPGSIAVAQREQAMLMQAQRKMRIAHYGRTPAKLETMVVPVDSSTNGAASQEEKRCSFITSNSDPLYVAYHDEEWGVPVHDDKMLFEILVLAGAQVRLDWTTILKKRNEFREAFAGFDAELVSRFSERQMASISAEYGLDLGKVRGTVDNANRILEVRREFGSLNKYLWGFVNNRPISPNYKSTRKIPVKTSKSESISKDMVRRGFRLVGPTVVHSFMQAAGLTNDHIISCPRHPHCSSLSTTCNYL